MSLSAANAKDQRRTHRHARGRARDRHGSLALRGKRRRKAIYSKEDMLTKGCETTAANIPCNGNKTGLSTTQAQARRVRFADLSKRGSRDTYGGIREGQLARE